MTTWSHASSLVAGVKIASKPPSKFNIDDWVWRVLLQITPSDTYKPAKNDDMKTSCCSFAVSSALWSDRIISKIAVPSHLRRSCTSVFKQRRTDTWERTKKVDDVLDTKKPRTKKHQARKKQTQNTCLKWKAMLMKAWNIEVGTGRHHRWREILTSGWLKVEDVGPHEEWRLSNLHIWRPIRDD